MQIGGRQRPVKSPDIGQAVEVDSVYSGHVGNGVKTS